jgi:hypothetical protein
MDSDAKELGHDAPPIERPFWLTWGMIRKSLPRTWIAECGAIFRKIMRKQQTKA